MTIGHGCVTFITSQLLDSWAHRCLKKTLSPKDKIPQSRELKKRTRAEDLCPWMCSFIKQTSFLPPGVKMPILCRQLGPCQHCCDITEWTWMLLFHSPVVITEQFRHISKWKHQCDCKTSSFIQTWSPFISSVVNSGVMKDQLLNTCTDLWHGLQNVCFWYWESPYWLFWILRVPSSTPKWPLIHQPAPHLTAMCSKTWWKMNLLFCF